ncbi:hypothetical protein FG386_000827 [Cryptosporidium ryanae]|uniref:uncharacterized protein n=1 Tax=Cryptosporidium ryanae TaxID=515981 RepID=UPI003519EE70|nr:hypothetical protein FG386_000827 [Cryptosporidium ryanae]
MPVAKKRGRRPILRKMEEENPDSKSQVVEGTESQIVHEQNSQKQLQEPSEKEVEENKEPQVDDRSDDPSCTLYVCRLSQRTKEDDLRHLFEDYGNVKDCHLVTNPLTGESRCFGFVTMSNEEEAARAKDAVDGKEYQDSNLKVETARRAKPYDPTPGEYKGPQYRSIKYSNPRMGYAARPYRGGSYKQPRGRYEYQHLSHQRNEQYNRYNDCYYGSRYYDNKYIPRADDYHPPRYHSPTRYSRADPYDSRYIRR